MATKKAKSDITKANKTGAHLDDIYKKHKSIINECRLNVSDMSYKAMRTYHERPLTGMAKVIDITNHIKSCEGNIPYEYTFNDLPILRERAKNDANTVHILYMSLLECLQDIEVNDMLAQILRLLQSYRAVGLMYDALKHITVSFNDKNTDLVDAIYDVLNFTGIGEKCAKVYEIQYIERKIAEIIDLERKGEQIIGADYRTMYDRKTGNEKSNTYRDWYKAHIFDNNSYTWRKRHDWETNIEIFPWLSKRVKYHNVKEGAVFVLSKTQKIKVIKLGEYGELVNIDATNRDEVIFDRNLIYDRSDYIAHSMLILHIGEINDGIEQVVSIYELKDILEKANVSGKYANKVW